MKIDAHQHFWVYDPIKYDWISDDMSVIRQNHLPEDLHPILKENGLDGCITVQSHQSEEENDFQLANASKNDFIKGVVGWVDLQAENIEERLAYYQQFPIMKGFRHVLQGEQDRALMLKKEFMNGISKLQQFGFTYDILIFEDQIDFSSTLVETFPNQAFVLDHIAKPDIKNQKITDWEKAIRKLAKHENVYCKVSGMVTEADWKNWKQEDFEPYMDIVFNAFGTDRLMYGSDWPVCRVAADYKQVLEIFKSYIQSLSNTEQAQVMGENAAKFYNI